MEKVTITQEQANAIDMIKGDIDEGITNGNIKAQIYKDWSSNPYSSLNELTTKSFLDALYIGYEVEPKFRVGDWVCVEPPKKSLPNVYKIMEVNRLSVNLDRLYGTHCNSEIRHATPEEVAKEKERRWWAKHDREIGQLIPNDVVYYSCHSWGGIYVVTSKPFAGDVFKNDHVRMWNVHRDTEISIKVNELKVICFADDRKDIGSDENETD